VKLEMFQSGKGDCLLLETKDGHHRMLIDGGVRESYLDHVAPAMGVLRDNTKHLDIVCISHIDQDHIAGVLQMFDDEAAWRVHHHQLQHANLTHTAPSSPRPAEIDSVFHNSFHDQIGKNCGAVEAMLAATAGMLSVADHPWLIQVADERRELASSIPQALKVSQRINPGQQNVPLNPQFDGALMLVRDESAVIELGSITLKVIGPFPEDLNRLRKDWNAWLERNQEIVSSIRAQGGHNSQRLSASDIDHVIGPLLQASVRLGAEELSLAKELGIRSRVTAPNLASLMFLAQEHGDSILLTGDGHADDILKGLDHHRVLDAQGRLHVSTLKVQHHGSEHNIHQKFCDAITADNYLFCGNGEHANPDLDVLRLIHDRRMAGDTRPFKFWFNSSSALSTNTAGRAHMSLVESLTAELATRAGGRLTSDFITGSSVIIS